MTDGMKTVLILVLVVVGVPTLLIGCVVASMFFSEIWPASAIGAILVAAVSVTSLVRTLRCNRFGRRWKWPVILGVWWALSLVCLPLTMIFLTTRSRALLSMEVTHLKAIAGSLETYRSDWDDRFPPASNWDAALDQYFPDRMGTPSQRPSGDEGWGPGDGKKYDYVPPKSGENPGDAVIISVTDWEELLGVHLYLYGDGRVEKRSVWPWWRYAWTGKLLH